MEEKIRPLVEPAIINGGYILTDLVYEKENGMNFLRIFIDKNEGYITINDCVIVNDLLDPILDTMDFLTESYNVDVSSTEKGIE